MSVIKSFRDLEVYQDLYKNSILIMTKIVPKLPLSEKYDLKDQISRASKACPRLIAEGYAKKHQKYGFQKYIDDAMAECNEVIVCLEHIKDIYRLEVNLCEQLIIGYDKSARQLFRLAQAWDKFKTRSSITTPLNHTGNHNSNDNQNRKLCISMIAALAKNNVIGKRNALPWYLPADLKHFKEKTLNKIIILGLNTFKSIGEKPLPNRKHIILTEDVNYKVPENCFVANSIEKAMEIAKELLKEPGQSQEIMICGGAMVYKQFLPLAQRMYLTYIDHDFDGDIFFPEFSMEDFKEVERENHESDDKNKYQYSFVLLERKR